MYVMPFNEHLSVWKVLRYFLYYTCIHFQEPVYLNTLFQKIIYRYAELLW